MAREIESILAQSCVNRSIVEATVPKNAELTSNIREIMFCHFQEVLIKIILIYL